MPIKALTINDLDQSQKEVATMQPYDSPMFVSGPPGSGKTSVAILRTKIMVENGFTNVLFLLYNHSLYGFLRKVFSKMQLANSINIQTKDLFFWNIFRDMGGVLHKVLPSYETYENKYYNILNFISKAEDKKFPTYPLLVLDESQDFSQKELEILKRISPKIMALADFDQQIYQATNADCFSNLPQKQLKTIYRFGQDIAKIAQPFSDSHNELVDKVTKVGRTPAYRVRANDETNALFLLCLIIKFKAVPNGTMAIICPRRDELQRLSDELRAKGIDHFFANNNNSLRDYDYDSKQPLLITPHSAKGMEFDVVILWKFTNYNLFDKKNKLIYLSMTRTCGELYLIQTQSTCPELKNLEGLINIEDKANSEINDF